MSPASLSCSRNTLGLFHAFGSIAGRASRDLTQIQEIATAIELNQDEVAINLIRKYNPHPDLVKKYLIGLIVDDRLIDLPLSELSNEQISRINFWIPSFSDFCIIRAFCKNRSVEFLVHFTRSASLPNILEHGLMSHSEVKARGCEVVDQWRYDRRSSYVCASISFPNYQMFYKCRQEFSGDWCVLILRPDLLWSRQCLFFPYNAASRELADQPRESFVGSTALRSLFGNVICGVERDPSLPSCFPTSPQAEVLIPGIIHSSDILSVVFESRDSCSAFQDSNYGSQVSASKNEYFFRPRSDFGRWKPKQKM